MQRNIFSPRFSVGGVGDSLGSLLTSFSIGLFVVMTLVTPIVFLPGVYTTIGVMKTIVIFSFVYFSLIAALLSLLRSGTIRLVSPLPVTLFWGFALFSVVAALLTDDRADALYGNNFDTLAAFYTVLMATVMTLGLLAAGSVRALRTIAYGGMVVTALLYGFVIARSFSWFPDVGVVSKNAILSPIGGLNDLAIFAGLVTVCSLLALYRLTLRRTLQGAIVALVVMSLAILGIVNFSVLWLVIGFFALVLFLYLLARDTWLSSSEIAPMRERRTPSRVALVMAGFVSAVAGLFMVGGDGFSQQLASMAQMQYVEVRPTLTGTIEILRDVYQHDAFFGVGPNRFEDAWRLYRDETINQTPYWNTVFTSGAGFLATVFVTHGLIGGLLLCAFLVALVYLSYRLFTLAQHVTDFQKTTILVAVGAALYLWVTFVLYVPGQAIAILAAVATGVVGGMSIIARYATVTSVTMTGDRPKAVVALGAAIIVMMVATSVALDVNRKFLGSAAYAKTIEFGTPSLAAFDAEVGRAMALYPEQDLFPAERARVRLIELNNLLNVVNPTTDEQQRYETLLAEAIPLAEEAVVRDTTNPYNYALLGTLYGLINPELIPEVTIRRDESFEEARRLDPINPEYYALAAQSGARFGNRDEAIRLLTDALQRKPDYTDALVMLAQFEFDAGNATSAIARARAVTTIEPQNPVRHFQLGLLLATTQAYEEARTAFEMAVTLDPYYANARYLLALTYIDLGQTEKAQEQLAIVAETNPGNEYVEDAIRSIEEGMTIERASDITMTRNEPSRGDAADTTPTTEDRDSTLVAPINENVAPVPIVSESVIRSAP